MEQDEDLAEQVDGALAQAEALVSASLLEIAERLSSAVRPRAVHEALLIFTLVCTGRPTKKAGSAEIVDRVTIEELIRLRDLTDAEHAGGERRAVIGGQERRVRTWSSPNGALLVLVEPGELDAAGTRLVERCWAIADWTIQHQVRGASPSYLAETRSISTARSRAVQELADSHTTALESLLATLRSRRLEDAAARDAAIEIASRALGAAREAVQRDRALTVEPVAGAFTALRQDLQPVARLGGLELDLVPPPADGRALPGEIAHAARWIVRSVALALVDRPDVTRMRVEWGCDGEHLLMNIRDNGDGERHESEGYLAPVAERTHALAGTCEATATSGWGAEIAITIPLDQQGAAPGAAPAARLTVREREVLQLVATGARNQGIATTLGISEHTVKFHVASLLRKLGAKTRAELVALTR
ncbi:helix-turn-helix transcriptional regulator [Gulosibacter sp. 10]|uniref:helix-turn-helix transcriptional regulator n=1 Tax=Gulosibacter sp. 10 TaxID=1255570 RepID=UPI00097F25DD|nr:helix-turn-helix transcriptional regulator [Gulosibacter sp. 10]SJM63738.1 transcriptional regulator, LuxR family [Gulosibacter sp. 10]